ncbi:MAG: hypothetical protein M0P77_06625 [Firmicutes bacterium]|nr:hypothetical protein [Bacillota bacterium]
MKKPRKELKGKINMKKINKMDYYSGAFITSLLNYTKSVPAIFGETNDSRRLEIDTDLGKFNLYIKYTTNCRNAILRGRKKRGG